MNVFTNMLRPGATWSGRTGRSLPAGCLLAAVLLLVLAGCESETSDSSVTPAADAPTTSPAQPAGFLQPPAATDPESLPSDTAPPAPVDTAVPIPPTIEEAAAESPAAESSTAREAMGAAVRATPTRAPSLLPPGMQITASVTGTSYVFGGSQPILIYRLTPPFDAGTSTITLIDHDTGLPSSLTPADRPLLLEFAGFDPEEALELGLYYLVRPRRLASEGQLQVQASPISVARVVADASGSLQQSLDLPPCAPAGDYLIVACRSGDCTLQTTEGSEPARAAWLKFSRAPAASPGESPLPQPELARVDPVSAFDGLNLRAGPSAATAILEHFGPGGLVELTGAARQSQGAPWFPVRDPITCVEGWVNGNFLQMPTP